MFGRRKALAKRFSLLLLEEEEDYLEDYLAWCRCGDVVCRWASGHKWCRGGDDVCH